MKTKQIVKAISIVGILALTTIQVKAQSTSSVSKALTAVKVVDNKGTVKYFQSNNGITQIVNTIGALTTTTWQLGGTLTDNTFIDVDGKVFALDGLALEAGAASTDASTLSDHGTGTGYTLLVRDEATGAIKKIMTTSIISGGVFEYPLVAADETANTFDSGTIAGLSTVKNRISVFRNGVKLLQGDWVLAAGEVTITSPTTFTLYTDDVIEVQWVK